MEEANHPGGFFKGILLEVIRRQSVYAQNYTEAYKETPEVSRLKYKTLLTCLISLYVFQVRHHQAWQPGLHQRHVSLRCTKIGFAKCCQ